MLPSANNLVQMVKEAGWKIVSTQDLREKSLPTLQFYNQRCLAQGYYNTSDQQKLDTHIGVLCEQVRNFVPGSFSALEWVAEFPLIQIVAVREEESNTLEEDDELQDIPFEFEIQHKTRYSHDKNVDVELDTKSFLPYQVPNEAIAMRRVQACKASLEEVLKSDCTFGNHSDRKLEDSGSFVHLFLLICFYPMGLTFKVESLAIL